jgi:Fe-S-cluster-containing hydrogenase component 2
MKKIKRKIINIDENLCNGCGKCIPACPEQALQIVETARGPKARLVKDFYCDGLGACLGSCPTGALTIVEKETVPYDDAATVERIKKVAPHMLETHIKHTQEHAKKSHGHDARKSHRMSGCPGSKGMYWGEKKENGQVETAQKQKPESQLRQWPLQLSLVNPAAPYFQNADLLIAADCVPFAYANFHEDFLKNKSLIIGCPKLDDAEFYREKLTELFKASDIKNVTVLNMEVPCCFGLQKLVKDAIKESGKKIPYCEIVIGIKGEVK